MLLGTLLVLCLAGFTAAQQRCYGDDLGCYPYVIPFVRPDSLENLRVTFRLYKAPTPDYEIITKDNILSTHFDSASKTIVIAGGYGSHPRYNYDMKDEILKLDPSLNVIIINSFYALRVGLKAFSNAPVVGGLLEQLLRALRDSAVASFSDFHLIGQSLGAHVVGYAGKRAQDNGDLIGRITGLDPNKPFYEGKSKDIILDPSDAAFVDCIRLDIGGLGIGGRCGTVDYYVNGGIKQPGCTDFAEMFMSCSHEGFMYMFVESINSNCSFIGYPCSSMDDFDSGACSDCQPGGCAVLGFKPDGQIGRSGSFYLRTNAQYPYCIDESR